MSAAKLEAVLVESEAMGVIERVPGGWRIADPDLAWWLDRLPPLSRADASADVMGVAA